MARVNRFGKPSCRAAKEQAIEKWERGGGPRPLHVAQETEGASYLLESGVFIESFEGRWLVVYRLHDHEAGPLSRGPPPAFRGLLGLLYGGGLEVGPLPLRRAPHFLRCLTGRARCCGGLPRTRHFCPWGCHAEMESQSQHGCTFPHGNEGIAGS